MITELEITWELKSPFHISNGVEIGGFFDSVEFIPATTIRGAIGFEYIRRYCTNEKFSNCTKGSICDECKFSSIFLPKGYDLKGACFENIILTDKRIKRARWGTAIDSEVKKAISGSLFSYSIVIDQSALKSRILIFNKRNELNLGIERVIQIISDGVLIGKKNSLGLGILEGKVTTNNFTSLEDYLDHYSTKIGLDNIDSINTLSLTKPIPLRGSILEKDIATRFNLISKALNISKNDFVITPITFHVGRISAFSYPGETRVITQTAIFNGTFKLEILDDKTFSSWKRILGFSSIFFDSPESIWCHCSLGSWMVLK